MLRAFTFGQCVFETPQARIAPESEVLFALLLSVAASPPDGIARDELVMRIWPRADDEERRHRLRQTLYRLRQLQVPVHLRAGFVAFDWDRTELDVHLLLHGALAHKELVRLGHLPFLPSFAPDVASKPTRWIEDIRCQVALRLRRALSDEVRSTRDRGRFHEMGQAARALLVLDPLNEVATFGLAESLALEGSKVEAVRLLDDYELEVGTVSKDLQLPARMLRMRVSEILDEHTLNQRFELPFAARDTEFESLRHLLRDVRSHSSGAAIVTGEAGIGKTRLLQELLRLVALDGYTVISYKPSAGDTYTPVSTLVSVSHLLLSLPGALGCSQEHLAYIRRLSAPDSVDAWHTSGLSADVLYAQFVLALSELTMAVAEESPLVLFVDDAERLHPTTWRVLMDLWERVRNHSVCMLFAARRPPNDIDVLRNVSCDRRVQQIRLAPLAQEDSIALAQRWNERHDAHIGDDSLLSAALASGGNPFFLAELLAHLLRGGDPALTPASIRDLLCAQYEALPNAAQRVLLSTAVLDTHATTQRIALLVDMGAADFMVPLAALEAAGLVTTRGNTIICRHRLVADVVLATEPVSVVRFAHSRAASLLEHEADATNSVATLGDCVTHWEAAGALPQACATATKLGHRLTGIGMGDEADKAFSRAADLATDAQGYISALEGRLTACRIAGRWSDMIHLSSSRQAALATYSAVSIGPEDHFALLEAEAALFSAESVPDQSRLLQLASHTEIATDVRIRAAVVLAILADNSFKIDALRAARTAAAAIQECTGESLDFAVLQAICHSASRDPEDTSEILSRLLSAAQRSPDFGCKLLGLRRAAEAAMRLGDTSVAFECVRDALTVARRLKLPTQEATCLERLVAISASSNDVSSAIGFSEELALLARKSDTSNMARLQLLASARIAWITSDADRARHVASAARALPVPPIPRAEQTLLAIRQAAAILTGGSSAQSSLSRLGELCALGAPFGDQDFAMSVFLQGLHHTGKATVARRIRAEYLRSERLERFPVPACLPVLYENRATRTRRRK